MSDRFTPAMVVRLQPGATSIEDMLGHCCLGEARPLGCPPGDGVEEARKTLGWTPNTMVKLEILAIAEDGDWVFRLVEKNN